MASDIQTQPDNRLNVRQFLRDVWSLTKPYFVSEEWKSAWGLLLVIVALNLALVGMTVILNFWRNDFYNTLQNMDAWGFSQLLFLGRPSEHGIFGFMPGFTLVAIIWVFVGIYTTYLNQMLQIRWRRWMTVEFLHDWLADRAYYRISMTQQAGAIGTDNPDQRIAEDLRDFVSVTLSLSLDFLSNVVQVASFIMILWGVSGAITLFGWTIPGYLVWGVIIYSVIGTYLTHLVGKVLAKLRFIQQKAEADWRYGLVRVRENAEGIALYNGEEDEKTALNERFQAVITNWWDIMVRTKKLNALTLSYSQAAVIFPYALAAPRYFAKAIQLGGLMQIADAFGQVQGSLSWFVSSYGSLMQWQAITARLTTFQRAIEIARAADGTGITIEAGEGGDVHVQDLTLELPTGAKLLEHENVTLQRGKSVVVTGASGSGKSTFFRAIAGIWPFGSGKIERQTERCLFLPQRTYIPLGPLARVVAFPNPASSYEPAAIAQALSDAGLPHLVDLLDVDDKWPQRLSGGEQQRIALARTLLFKPDWLFLDEATASLDPEAETFFYRTLKERLPNTTIISIAHRPAVASFHDEKLTVRRGENGAPGKLERTTISGDDKSA
jgi:putative ATP-binding cassette transporter